MRSAQPAVGRIGLLLILVVSEYTVHIIDKSYPDGQSTSSSQRSEPFAALFWALSIAPAHILHETDDPARRPGIHQLWYWHGTVQQGSVRFNLREEMSPPSLFPSRCTYGTMYTYSILPIQYTWNVQQVQYSRAGRFLYLNLRYCVGTGTLDQDCTIIYKGIGCLVVMGGGG